MRVARIGGRRVAYETYGDPRGQPVLIIHGAWGGPSSTLWTGPRLRWSAPSDGLKLIWYDRRCAGLSQYDTQPFALEDLAYDAVEVLDYLQIEQAAVIASSAGGPIGMRLALDHPDRVSALVLLNTGAALMSLNPTGVNLDDPFVADRLETVARRIALLKLMESEGRRGGDSAIRRGVANSAGAAERGSRVGCVSSTSSAGPGPVVAERAGAARARSIAEHAGPA